LKGGQKKAQMLNDLVIESLVSDPHNGKADDLFNIRCVRGEDKKGTNSKKKGKRVCPDLEQRRRRETGSLPTEKAWHRRADLGRICIAGEKNSGFPREVKKGGKGQV